MRFTFLGAYDPSYPRNAVIRKGLALNGADVRECRTDRKFKFWARYPILISKAMRRSTDSDPNASQAKSIPKGLGQTGNLSRTDADRTLCPSHFGPGFIFVPEFGQKDVPLAKFLGLLTARKVIFDPLAARYETKIIDWRRKAADSPSAWWNFQIDRTAFAGADLILADTAAHKNYYCSKYGLDPHKVEVLPLGYDDDLFKPRVGREDKGAAVTVKGRAFAAEVDPLAKPGAPAAVEKENAPFAPFHVLFIGSFLPLHGTDVIIEAARIVAGQDPSVRFTLIGTGQTLPSARRIVENSGLKNVEFAGWRPTHELSGIIGAADICLGIFGRTEKARRVVPHKIVQAMGVGKAVITARMPAVEEFFVHGENIFFGDEPYAESLARAILEMKMKVALREKIARNGYDLVRAKFSPGAIGRSLIEIVERHFPHA